MATPQNDGSIILSTKIDTSGMKKSTNELRSEAMKLAAQYRKAGMSQSEAQKKAYEELGITTKETEKATKKTKEYGEQAQKSGSKAKTAFSAVGKAAAALAVAFAAAVIAVTKQAVDAYAEYEQLVGGVETLFKGSSKKLIEYANEAYKTAGLSANEYMQTVTSFSASLISSLGGDTEKAADAANQALIDMSDNANKMGTSMEAIQNAYQGFAKQNYTMLDNLKLGYGGTKIEMERLLKDAQALTGVKYDISNLADVYSAIHAIQENLGITGTTAKEAATTISGSAATMKAAWQNVLTAISGGGDLDKAIENLVDSVSNYFENIVPVVERALSGIGVLIEKIAPRLVQTVAKSLIQAIPSLLNAVYQMIIGLAKGIYEGIKALFTGGTTESIKEQTEQISESVENQEALTDEVKNTEKALKKTLAGFDDLQILTSGASEESDIANTIQNSVDSITGLGGESSGTTSGNDAMGIAKKIEEAIDYLLPVIELGLIVIGLIVLSTGNIPLGIGFIAAGAYLYSVTERSEGGFDFNVIKEDLQFLVDWLEEILVTIGIILLLLGQVPLGIGFILVGAIVYGVKEIQSEEYDTATFKEKLAVIVEAVSTALIAIGVLLILFGHIALGIGFLVVGKVLLDITEETLNEGEAQTKLQKFFEDNQKLFVGIGLALVVLGLLLLLTPISFPIALGLIAAGAGALAAESSINGTKIVDDIKNFLFENSALISLISGGLLILGIILCATGAALPLGIGLIVAGAAGLVTESVLNKDAIVHWIKEIWEEIKNFWNTYIAPVFTAKFWLDLAKKCGNGLIEGFENAINGIIGMFEKMINWIVGGLNKISFDVPDWVPGIGGKTFGFNIPEVKFGRVSIPRLAQGAVIPANREFLAVLGDQKQGVNIEAPLDTIVEAFNIALAQNNNARSGNTEVVLEIDGREFGRAVVEQGNKENRRIGTRLVIA